LILIGIHPEFVGSEHGKYVNTLVLLRFLFTLIPPLKRWVFTLDVINP